MVTLLFSFHTVEMSLEEKFQSVLNLLRTEDSLHDDTYLAQFLDNTARVINTRQDLDSYGLEQFLRQNLSKIRELGFSAEFNVKFILELSRTVIMKGDGSIPPLSPL